MVSARQGTPTRLLTGGAIAIAALATAGMSSAVPEPLAFGLAGVLPTARNLLLPGPTPTPLGTYLQARRTAARVAALAAVVDAAGQELVTGVPAQPHILSARKLPFRFSTRALPGSRPWARQAGTFMTHSLTLVLSARQQLATDFLALPRWVGTGSVCFRCSTQASLQAFSWARLAIA